MMNRVSALMIFVLLPVTLLAADLRPFAIDDLYRIQRISDPAISPDGSLVVYTVTACDVSANKTSTELWITSMDGNITRRLARTPIQDRHAAWSPDGKSIAFESKRSGTSQIWLMNPVTGEAREFTNISTEATSPVWSPDGKWIAFVSSVYPEFSDKPFSESNKLNKQKDDEIANNTVKVRVYTRLFVRHWDTWGDGKRQHIFVESVLTGETRDLTPGDRDANPTSETFSAGIDFAFSPDSKEIAYTAIPAEHEAWSTNHDIYAVPVTGGQPKQITTNPAADGYPRYSPDGKYIAYRAQTEPGSEADRWQLWLYDRATGKTNSISSSFDASVGSQVWSRDSQNLYFEAEEKGHLPLYQLSVSGQITKIYDENSNGSVNISADGKWLIFMHESAVRSADIYKLSLADQKATKVTKLNDELFAALDIPAPENVWYDGDGGTKIQGWLFKPPKFDSTKKYPFVYLIHGGPQGAWHDGWHYRWNPALWAAQGYVIFAPNPRGSTGFGQQFTNEISQDWGGKVFQDLVKGLEYAESLPYIDKERKAAAGASFGGFMANWFEGHLPGRFKTIICHDGTFNERSEYASTEELWFDEHEHGGTPWEKPELYDRDSPDRYADKFETPMLIIHGERDFRIPYTQGLQTFTTLQRKGIPSKLVLFPEENHWVLKPGDSRFWHQTVFDWLKEYLK
ncbi:MAG: S9 family peptidase [Acidobacteria bacterium]|nr:MAG: S9 family peptidase [Acidobacteriota bacterium]